MSEHTKGPWAWKVGGDLLAADGNAVIRDYGYEGLGFPGPNMESNMKLVAAAPELLEACQAMVAWDDREKDHAVDFHARMQLCAEAFDKARAAIAKAS